MSVKVIPAGHHTVTPYLAIKGAVKALEFYKKAFGATESFRLMMRGSRSWWGYGPRSTHCRSA